MGVGRERAEVSPDLESGVLDKQDGGAGVLRRIGRSPKGMRGSMSKPTDSRSRADLGWGSEGA
jgi:hypothetical protein